MYIYFSIGIAHRLHSNIALFDEKYDYTSTVSLVI